MHLASEHSINLNLAAPADLPERLKAHLPQAEISAQRNLKAVKAKKTAVIEGLLRQLRRAQTPAVSSATKITRIRHIAGEFSKVFEPHSACTNGCSHCCHIDVAVPRAEATLIAKAIGRPLSEPTKARGVESADGTKTFFGVPCTFLAEGKCSIYVHRPLVCRTLVNMDSEDTLCQLVPGVSVPVPYLNTMEFQAYFAFVMQNEAFADLREWFPREP